MEKAKDQSGWLSMVFWFFGVRKPLKTSGYKVK
jgi:hypothetical protein